MNRCLSLLLASLLMLAVGAHMAPAQVVGQVPLNPANIPQFVDPLPHFAGLRVGATTDLYVKAVPHQQRAVSTGTVLAAGATGLANLWVYQLSTDNSNWTPKNWPAYTIDAMRGQALNVKYINELVGQTYADVGLVVDPTLHAAEPLMSGMYDPMTTEPPIAVHLHGGEVPPWSDGGPDSWFMPGNPPSPRGHAYVTDTYLYPNTQEAATLWFHDHALGATRLNVYAGMAGFYLLRDPNEDLLQLPGFSGDDLVQEVAPAGASGVFSANPYLPEIEIAIQDRMFDNQGKLYFPNLPTNPTLHPSWTPEFVGDVITVNGKTWPYMSVAPRKYRVRLLNGSNARFYNLSFPGSGPTITQIGTDGGFLDAPVALGSGPLLLAPGERADLIIDFTGLGPKKTGKISSYILNNDAKTPFPGGVKVNPKTTGRIIQFVVNGTMVSAANPANPGSDKSIIPTGLKTNVKLTNFAGAPVASVPVTKVRELTLNEVMGPGGPVEILVNNTKWSGVSVAPEFSAGTGVRTDFSKVTVGGVDTYYSETMQEGETEIWQIINQTADAHPIHLHLVQFQLMSRQLFNTGTYNTAYNALFPASAAIDPMTNLPYPGGVFIGGYGPPLQYSPATPVIHPKFGVPTLGGNLDVTPYLQGPVKPAKPNERGWKDTFIMYPGEVTTVIARWAPTDKAENLDPANPANQMWFPFDPNGGHGYVWHCHIIDHEDNEMMRPYSVTPNANASRTFARVALAQEIAVVSEKPVSFGLDQNYPNPFNPTTEIRFTIPENSRVVLRLYNALGQEVQTLLNNEVPAGNHSVSLNASKLASGTYFYRLQAGNNVAIKKMMLVK